MDMAMPMPPSFHVNEKQISEIKRWEVGKKYKLEIEVELKSKHEMKMDGKITADASFDIVAYDVEKDYEDMSDDEMEMEQAKALSSKK